MNNQQLERK